MTEKGAEGEEFRYACDLAAQLDRSPTDFFPLPLHLDATSGQTASDFGNPLPFFFEEQKP
jgi:hypothetical protein